MPAFAACPFRKFHPGWIRIVRQNHRTIDSDVCNPARTGNVRRRPFQVSTVSKYMARPSRPPSQSWNTFLRNHAEAIAAIDMCVVPTLTFDRLFAFLVLGHDRRQLLWFEMTRHPTAEWLARQITEAFPWASAPAYLVRDNDRAYGHVLTSRVRADGYPRSTDFSSIAMAKWYCGTSDWRTASRVPGPNGHLRRGAPTPDSFRLCSVLQSSAYALGITKRCAVTSSRPTVWRHCSDSNPGRATSSIRPDIIFGKDRWVFCRLHVLRACASILSWSSGSPSVVRRPSPPPPKPHLSEEADGAGSRSAASAQNWTQYQSVCAKKPVLFWIILLLVWADPEHLELLTFNQRVQGSSPCAPTNKPLKIKA